MGKELKIKTYILCYFLGAITLSGCFWGHIERSEPLTYENAPSLVGKEATLTPNDSTVYEATILGITKDSVLLSADSPSQCVALANVGDILLRGGIWGRVGGGLALGVIGGSIGRSMNKGMEAIGTTYLGFFLGALFGGLLGEGVITPDWRYIVTPKKSEVLEETKEWGGTNPQYVLVVEKFITETDSTVAIPWQQGKTVTLPKSEITIEKHEKGFRITVPARLLQ